MKPLTEEEKLALTQLYERVERGNPYEVLGVPPTADQAEIKRAYLDLTRSFHPDRFFRRDVGGFGDLIEQAFIGINQAWETLRDPDRRARWDREHRDRRQRTSGAEGAASHPPASGEVAEAGHRVRTHLGRARKAGETWKEPSSSPAPPSAGSQVESAAASRPGRRRRLRNRVQEHWKQRDPLERVRRHLAEQLARARRYYQAGMEDMEEGRWIKAAGSLYLATQFDPKNEEYRRRYEEARRKADEVRAAQFVVMAENAENYRNVREAIANYQKAVDCDPPSGKPFFRLAELLRHHEEDLRGALKHYRMAVLKEPNEVRYRMALADFYAELDMRNNAMREYQAVLRLQPDHAEARAGLKRVR